MIFIIHPKQHYLIKQIYTFIFRQRPIVALSFSNQRANQSAAFTLTNQRSTVILTNHRFQQITENREKNLFFLAGNVSDWQAIYWHFYPDTKKETRENLFIFSMERSCDSSLQYKKICANVVVYPIIQKLHAYWCNLQPRRYTVGMNTILILTL